MKTIPHGSTVGIFGGGQLGKMLAIAAAQLGYKTCIYSDVRGCACDVATSSIIAPYSDVGALDKFSLECDVVTTEFENIPVPAMAHVRQSDLAPLVFPGETALKTSQDRRLEKAKAASLCIPTPKYWIIETKADLNQDISYPVILKTARGGYDGRGQERVANREALNEAWSRFKQGPCVAEKIVDFDCELSVILARNASGQIEFYDCFENSHKNGILDMTVWPAVVLPSNRAHIAIGYARSIAENLNVVGLLAVEFFYSKNGEIIFNEIAPRPHNSGHITLDTALTNQFEQHIRAICGLPFGSPGRITSGVMRNVIGNFDLIPNALRDPKAKVHLYGKEAREGRKLGHVNYVC